MRKKLVVLLLICNLLALSNVGFTAENDIPKPVVKSIGIGKTIDEFDYSLLL